MRRVLLCVMLIGCRPGASEVPGATGGPVAKADPVDDTSVREPDDLSPILIALRDEHAVPSLAAAVVDAKGVLAIGSYGLRRIDEETAVTNDDKYHLGSNTKAMTATIVARLVDRNELRWDLTLGEAWGEGVHESYRAATLTDLLQHRAGVPVDAIAFKALANLDSTQSPEQHRAVVTSTVLAKKPLHDPGSKYLYSNLGYIVAAAIVERHTSKSWEQLMRDEVFAPLDMSSCGFGPPAIGGSREQPWGHQFDADHFRPAQIDNPPYYGPAGTVHCSLADYAKFARAHFSGSDHVSDASLAVLHKAIAMEDGQGAYAMGWGVPQTKAVEGPVLAHDGSNGLNYASILLLPEQRMAVVAACNGGGERAQRAIVATVLALFGRYVLDQKAGLTRR